MKKIIIMLAITISSLAAFASEENVNKKVLNAFSQEFAGAKDVKWTTNETFSRASFVFNGQYVYAYYQLDGELLAMTRNISSLDLPINLQSSLKKGYEGYWISDLFEISNNDGTNYYITMENADWNSFKKSAKI
jgi:hypothetical protein